MQMMTFTLELVRPLDRKLFALKKKMKLFKQVVSMRAATLYCSQDASYCVASMRSFKLRWRRHLHLHHPSISVGTLVHLALEVISDMSRDKQLELA